MPKYRRPVFNGVPAGKYEVEIIDGKDGVSRNGNEMIMLKICAKPGTRWFYEHLVFTEECAWKVAEFLNALGEELPDGKDIHADDFVGRKADAIVTVDDPDCPTSNTIKRWLPATPKPKPSKPASLQPPPSS